MKNLNLLEQEALGILKQLEFGCAQYENLTLPEQEHLKILAQRGVGGVPFENLTLSEQEYLKTLKELDFWFDYIEITPFFKMPGRLGVVTRFLNGSGLIFSAFVDGINNPLFLQDETIVSDTILVIIKGENIQSINTKIEELISKLNLEDTSGSISTNNNNEGMNENIQDNELDDKIKISKKIKDKYKNICIRHKNGKSFLNLGKRKIYLGKFNTRTYKLVKYILEPTSKSKNVIDIFEQIKISKDRKNEELEDNTPQSYALKKEVIEKAVDELQKGKFIKGHILKPIFDDKKRTATIKFK